MPSRYIVQQAAQELAAVEAEPIDSDSDMDDNHFSPPPPEEDMHSEHSEPAQVSSNHSTNENVQCLKIVIIIKSFIIIMQKIVQACKSTHIKRF